MENSEKDPRLTRHTKKVMFVLRRGEKERVQDHGRDFGKFEEWFAS